MLSVIESLTARRKRRERDASATEYQLAVAQTTTRCIR